MGGRLHPSEATGAQVPSIAVRAEMALERGPTGKAPLIVGATRYILPISHSAKRFQTC